MASYCFVCDFVNNNKIKMHTILNGGLYNKYNSSQNYYYKYDINVYLGIENKRKTNIKKILQYQDKYIYY